MYPDDIHLFGVDVSIWNTTLIAAVTIGYPILVASLRIQGSGPRPRLLPLRWLVTVYFSAIGAQLFAYIFDTYTSVWPPNSVGWLRYYFDPLFGSKTLYGAIAFLPLTVALVTKPWRDLDYVRALDGWTPAMFTVLGTCRIGCLLQGCCYGTRSDTFGIAFPATGTAFWSQVTHGMITKDAASTLPIVPTQAISAIALFAMAAWTFLRIRRGNRSIFPDAIALYSLFRLVIEFVRDDISRNFYGPLSTSQWLAVAVLMSWAAIQLHHKSRGI